MKKMKYIDIAVTVIFLAVLVALYFVWGCKWDPIVTAIAAAIIVIAGVVAHNQRKKLEKLEEDNQQK